MPAGGAVPISWTMKAPDAPGKLIWTIEAASKDGKQRDRLVFDQMIEPAVPIETWAASLLHVGADTGLRRASCRERVCQAVSNVVVAGAFKKTKIKNSS